MAAVLFPTSAVAAPPSNDPFASPVVLSGTSDTESGTNLDASKESGEPQHAGDAGGASVWYAWTAPEAGKFRTDTCDTEFPTLLGVYTGTAVNSLTPIVSNAGGCDGSRVVFDAVAGTEYRFAVDGDTFGGEQPVPMGDFNLVLRKAIPPANDDLAQAHQFSGTSASATGTNVDASWEPDEQSWSGLDGGASVWYRWVAPVTGTGVVNLCGSDFDTTVIIFEGLGHSSHQLISYNDDHPGACPGGLQSRAPFSAVAGRSYEIAVDGYLGQEGTVRLTLGYEGGVPSGPSPPPAVQIDKIAVNHRKRTATAHFSAAHAPGGFLCRLDDGSTVPCLSPLKIGKAGLAETRLTRGAHDLFVYARDSAGNVLNPPAIKAFNLRKSGKKGPKKKGQAKP